jgi:hypothetical protein
MAEASGKGAAAAAGGGTRSTPLRIPRYDPNRMKPDATVLVVGPRRTGKSTLVLDLLYSLREHIFASIAQTPTCETAEELSKIIPWSCIHDDFDPAALERAVNAMKQLVNTDRKLAAKLGGEKDRRILLVLLDDCMADPKNLKYKVIQDIFYNGRHYDLFFLNVMQQMMDMPPKFRTNTDIIICTYDSAPDNQERLWRYFFKTAYPRLEQFRRVYAAVTANFGCIVLDRTIRGVPDEQKVFWYRARHPAPVYRLGDRSQWFLHCRYLRSRADELKTSISYIVETTRRAAGAGAADEAVAAEMPDEINVL